MAVNWELVGIIVAAAVAIGLTSNTGWFWVYGKISSLQTWAETHEEEAKKRAASVERLWERTDRLDRELASTRAVCEERHG